MSNHQNFAKLLAPVIRRHYQKVRDFDTEDFEPVVECPECGYDGEGLEERVKELEAEISRLNGAK